MNKAKIEKLTEKYEAGASTLSEEKFLLDNAENLKTTIRPWFKFIKLNKKEAPLNFNESLWESIQTRRIKKRRFTIGIMSMAASIIILVSVFTYNDGYKKLSYQEKKALLSEALDMFEDPPPRLPLVQNIIYEDDIIIVYTTAR